MGRRLALVAPCLLGACFMARQDARIRPGGQIGVTTVAMYTPDAVTENPDAGLRGLPPRNDASDVRGYTEITLAYGWKRVELRWHIPTLRWNATNDFLFTDHNVDGPDPLVGSLELYLQLVHYGRLFAGVGVESARGGYAVVTGELGPRDAISATARAIYGGSEDLGGPDGRRRSVQLQGQVSYTHELDANHDLRFLVSAITFDGDRDPAPVRSQGSFTDGQGDSTVSAPTIWMVGASIDWH
jgi:hypothetical protein